MPNHWTIQIEREPRRVMQRLPRTVLERIRTAIHGLIEDPRPKGCKKLTGHDKLWRIRVGDWRITYAIQNEELVVLIVEVSPRGGAYRNL